MLPHDEEFGFICCLVVAEELEKSALHVIVQVERTSVWEVHMLDNCKTRLNRVHSAIFARTTVRELRAIQQEECLSFDSLCLSVQLLVIASHVIAKTNEAHYLPRRR